MAWWWEAGVIENGWSTAILPCPLYHPSISARKRTIHTAHAVCQLQMYCWLCDLRGWKTWPNPSDAYLAKALTSIHPLTCHLSTLCCQWRWERPEVREALVVKMTSCMLRETKKTNEDLMRQESQREEEERDLESWKEKETEFIPSNPSF